MQAEAKLEPIDLQNADNYRLNFYNGNLVNLNENSVKKKTFFGGKFVSLFSKFFRVNLCNMQANIYNL